MWSPSPCYSAELSLRDLPLEKMYFICKESLQHHRLTGHEFEQTPGDSEDREAFHAAVHGAAKSWTQLSD